MPKGIRRKMHPNSKLTLDQVKFVKRNFQKVRGKLSGAELARQLNVTNAAIYDIKNGKTYRDVTV